jgi:hypothetical protein
VRFEFTRAGVAGAVEAELAVNDEPSRYGCPELARGFPICRATISPEARGYGDFLGWVQLIASDLHGPDFVVDTFQPLGRPPHPFAFYGFAPILFDAPHADVDGWSFLAHTFLCGLGKDPLGEPGRIDAVLGFSWGFQLQDGSFAIESIAPLAPSDWDRHLPYLRETYPAWTFQPGFGEAGSDR